VCGAIIFQYSIINTVKKNFHSKKFSLDLTKQIFIMKGMIQMKQISKNENKGFSLVELIVVIAIMAVMTAVLAPSLLAYVERSRAQKDDSAMSEVANATLLGMSDQDIFDELLAYSAYGNYSCYIDTETEAGLDADGHAKVNQVITKSSTGSKKAQYMYDDNARLADETPYHAAGNMRGVTITFQPSKKNNSNGTHFVLENAIINKFLQPSGSSAATLIPETKLVANDRVADSVDYVGKAPSYATKGTLATMSSDNVNYYLYNRVRSNIGDNVDLTSQTYRNSEYTIFIRMGTTGGAQSDAQDAITVYGQWNGTNLAYQEGESDGVDVGGIPGNAGETPDPEVTTPSESGSRDEGPQDIDDWDDRNTQTPPTPENDVPDVPISGDDLGDRDTHQNPPSPICPICGGTFCDGNCDIGDFPDEW
jgi:prepilin-type N-terminal cleavage/methylation domain-containing protein